MNPDTERKHAILDAMVRFAQKPQRVRIESFPDERARRAAAFLIGRDVRDAMALIDALETTPEVTGEALREAFAAVPGFFAHLMVGDRGRYEAELQYPVEWRLQLKRKASLCAVCAAALRPHVGSLKLKKTLTRAVRERWLAA